MEGRKLGKQNKEMQNNKERILQTANLTRQENAKSNLIKKISKRLTKRNDRNKEQIGMGYDESCLNISSMKVDDMGTTKKFDKLIPMVKNQRIDISCVQETHNDEQTTYKENGYKIILSNASNDEDKTKAKTSQKVKEEWR